MTLVRHCEFVPGYDRRHSDPSKNYAISGGRFLFAVVGPKGAVHFSLMASFYPDSAIAHLVKHHDNNAAVMMQSFFGPMGADVGYHAPVPQYEGQIVGREHCEWLGAPCYCDGSALRGQEWGEDFLRYGTEWLWPALEREYREHFDQQEAA